MDTSAELAQQAKESQIKDAFHHVFVDKNIVENQLIEYDLEHFKELQTDKPNALGHALHGHYMDSYKHIQLAYGKKESFDFQHYSWGFCLCLDDNAPLREKLTILFSYYPLHVSKRVALNEFEAIIKKHTSFRDLEPFQKKLKWDDLVASFKLHSRSKQLYPDTIGQRQMEIIMDANKLTLCVDIHRLMRYIKSQDKIGRRIFDLLEDDPLLNGQTKDITMHIQQK